MAQFYGDKISAENNKNEERATIAFLTSSWQIIKILNQLPSHSSDTLPIIVSEVFLSLKRTNKRVVFAG